jgi:serine/threonine protein kinase/ActR/RegA family two-component response regulator
MYPFTILVADEDEEFRSFLVTVLQDQGFSVSVAESGKEVVERIQKDKPRLIITDLLLPDIAGDALCRTIKENAELRDIILFILSSSTDLETKLACIASGANEYLTKPIEVRELIARIHGFIRMIDQLKSSPVPASQPPENTPVLFSKVEIPERDKTHGTVELIGVPSLSESFGKIKPRYGIYRVENLIGSGAMGHVFKAYDEPLDRYVAVKILSKKLSNSPEFVERFRREAKLLASINHPGIAFIYSFGEQEGEHYFAMQWCPGGSLSGMIRSKQRVEVLPAIDIILQCAQALSAASKKGVVHRDVKPSNILFDENQHVKIVDFGIAFAQNSSARLTQVQEFLGTPSFMAPEQAQSSTVDHRADVYSLGITLYYMLYGKLPFKAESAIEMVVKHSSEAFPAFEDLGGTVPRQVYSIIEKMTQKNSELRYPDYPSLIEDLENTRNALLRQSLWKIPKAFDVSQIPALQSTNAFELLSNVYRKGTSGVMTFRWSSLQKKFLVRQREIILFESTQQDENIWNWLVQKEVLKKEDITSGTPNDLEKSLNRFLLNNTFTMESFKTSYRELMNRALTQIFFWPVCEGEFSAATLEHDAFTTIRITDVLLEAARNLIDLSSVKASLMENANIVRTGTFEQVLSTLNLRPEESFLASRFDGSDTTLNTLHLLTGLSDEVISRFVYALDKMGAVEFRKVEPRVATPRRMTESQRLAPQRTYDKMPVRESTSTRVSESHPGKVFDSGRVTDSHPKKVAESNPAKPAVTSSSASPSSSSSRLEEKFGSATGVGRRLVDPPSTSHPSAEEEKKEGTPPGGTFVRMEVQKSEKKMEEEHHIKVAEQFYRLAEEKMQELDYWKVTQLCRQAIKNNPTESKYYHLMAVAYAQHPRFGKDAEQCFYKALEMDPWNPDYHVDLARFYQHQGLPMRAINQVKKALKIAPEHRAANDLFANLSSKKK